MDYIKNKYLKESVWFLEKCQMMTLKEKIDTLDYFSLTTCKLGFINNLLNNEAETLFVNKELKERLYKLFDRDNYIYNKGNKAVSK